jgi:hypothetical protein
VTRRYVVPSFQHVHQYPCFLIENCCAIPRQPPLHVLDQRSNTLILAQQPIDSNHQVYKSPPSPPTVHFLSAKLTLWMTRTQNDFWTHHNHRRYHPLLFWETVKSVTRIRDRWWWISKVPTGIWHGWLTLARVRNCGVGIDVDAEVDSQIVTSNRDRWW